MIAWGQRAGQPQAGQGCKPAKPVARSASLDGPGAVRQGLSRRSRLGPTLDQCHPSARCAGCHRELCCVLFRSRQHFHTSRGAVQAVQKRCAHRCLRPKPTGRTSRLLSCHRSVGGLRLASPAQFFAKLRSDKNQAKRSGSSFRADSLQPLCRLFGGPHVRHVRQMDRSQDAGAASAVPVVC